MTKRVVINLRQPAGLRIEDWILTKYHCPNCGQKPVWVEDDPGDYYVGSTYICVNCSHYFYLPNEPYEITGSDAEFNVQRLKGLK